MTLGQIASVTDRGRKRRHNEDAYVVEPPLFAIADGMGGAQAGEVAARLAASALREGVEQGSGEDRVATLIQKANRRVYERSGEDASLSGMGTTTTVAVVEDSRVVIGHVGDSRAYLIRDGLLDQLTEDHSLVAELARAGKLSEEEAEIHPQRSVITRTVGTDPDVDVDTLSVRTRPGDVFLLCSDGLTSMVDDEQILEVIRDKRDDLAGAAKALVKAANKAGGEDNIPILFFEIAETPVKERREPAPGDEEDTLTGIERVPAVTTVRKEALPRARPRRTALYWAAGIVLVLLLAGLGLFAISRAHFVGARRDGHVTVYQGVPWDLGGGIHLYRAVYVSPLLVSQLTQNERKKLFDHDLMSYGSARDDVRRYEQEVVP